MPVCWCGLGKTVASIGNREFAGKMALGSLGGFPITSLGKRVTGRRT